MPPIAMAGGGGAEHSRSPHTTFSSISVAARRERWRSESPLSTQPRTRLVEPSGSGMSKSMTTRLWSRMKGTVTDFISG